MLKPFYNRKKNIDDRLVPEVSVEDAGKALVVGDDEKITTGEVSSLLSATLDKGILVKKNSGIYTISGSPNTEEYLSIYNDYGNCILNPAPYQGVLEQLSYWSARGSFQSGNRIAGQIISKYNLLFNATYNVFDCELPGGTWDAAIVFVQNKTTNEEYNYILPKAATRINTIETSVNDSIGVTIITIYAFY